MVVIKYWLDSAALSYHKSYDYLSPGIFSIWDWQG